MKLIFATGNRHKLYEASKILGADITLIMPKDLGITEEIPETGDTIAENSQQKCNYIIQKVFGPAGACTREHTIARNADGCFADDTGLEVEALDGAPGVHSARYATNGHDWEANIDKLLAELHRVNGTDTFPLKRRARFRTIVTLYLHGKIHTFEGQVNGVITLAKQGSNGFGYDSVFLPDGASRTMAQMTDAEKNAISHRGVAIRKLAAFLKAQ